jgi:hypothetical protein
LSGDDGIVRFSTRFTDKPSGFIYFDPSRTGVDKIKQSVTKQKLTIFTSETSKKDIDNPFHIKPEGKIVNAENINLDEEN